jgi:L-fuconolactonase
MTVNRREFLAACAAAPLVAASQAAPDVLLDVHTHFYDPSRPAGVAWPPKDDAVLYRTVLPDEYKRLAAPLGLGGTVVVEASPKVEDNDWLLDLVDKDDFIPGIVGHLKPGRPGFADDLKRLSARPKFRGIRVGGWDIPLDKPDSAFGKDLAKLADLGYTVDVVGGGDLLDRTAALAKALPDLWIIIDHVAGVRIDGKAPPAAWVDSLRACAAGKHVYMKISGLPENTGKKGTEVPTDTAYYAPVLDAIWEAFGDERVVFGSNWPVSARFASLETVFKITDGYVRPKGANARGRLFTRNARRFYGLKEK